MDDDPNKVVELDIAEKRELVEKKATCPFIGSALAQGKLAIRNDVSDPLASIEDVRTLGNSGGGDLGDLLVVFATGNHAFMRGSSGMLDKAVPIGLFSLEFPGSQGSHPGHSGILQGDPAIAGSGHLSRADFARLASRAKEGWIKRSDVGSFIAENLLKDPKSKVFGNKVATLLAGDLLAFVETIGPAWVRRLFGSGEDARTAHRDFEEKLTKLLGEDNLVGSAGEFGLLFALLANKPGAREIDGEPAVSLRDVEAMFLEKRLPDGWETWKKSRMDWVKNTTGLLLSAGKTYWALKRHP
jgi:hypothetical protein